MSKYCDGVTLRMRKRPKLDVLSDDITLNKAALMLGGSRKYLDKKISEGLVLVNYDDEKDLKTVSKKSVTKLPRYKILVRMRNADGHYRFIPKRIAFPRNMSKREKLIDFFVGTFYYCSTKDDVRYILAKTRGWLRDKCKDLHDEFPEKTALWYLEELENELLEQRWPSQTSIMRRDIHRQKTDQRLKEIREYVLGFIQASVSLFVDAVNIGS